MITRQKLQMDTVWDISVNKKATEPAYQQIAIALKYLLQTGRIPADTAMPPERILAQRFGVSRMTMRQANQLLEQEGLIERQQGRGTFAAQNHIMKRQQETRGFTEEIRQRGGVPSSRVISFSTVEASPSSAETFGIEQGDLLYEIQRVRLADEVPIAFESAQIPRRHCPNLERFNLVNYSLYQILEENYGIQLDRSEEELSAIQPKKVHRELLNMTQRSAVLLIKRRTYTADGTLVEIATTAYHGDLYTSMVYSQRPGKHLAPPIHLPNTHVTP